MRRNRGRGRRGDWRNLRQCATPGPCKPALVSCRRASRPRSAAPDGARKLSIVIDIDPYLVTQDIAIAVTFLLTELIEMAMTLNQDTQIRVSVKPGESEERAALRVNAPSLVDNDALRAILSERYGRVIEGLSRQLRSRLHHDPLVGAYEISIAVTGRD